MKSRFIKTDRASIIALLLVITLIISICPIAPLKVYAATALNTNLIVNGNGEFSTSRDMGSYGWSGNTGNWYAYTSGIGGITPHGGSQVMGIYSSGPGWPMTRECYQDINISSLSTLIDSNSIVANFDGWIQKTGVASGEMGVRLQGLDSYGTPLGVASEYKYGSSTGWKNIVFADAVLAGTSKLRVTLFTTEVCNGAGAFDDLSLKLTSNEAATPTIDTPIADQATVTGGSIGPISFNISDADTAATALSVTAVSSDQNVIPNGNITLGGTDTNRSISFTAVAAGVTTVTVTVSDGAKKAYAFFKVTVNPNVKIGNELVINGNGASAAGWTGETSRYLYGSSFKVGSVPGEGTPGNTAISEITQDINIGKFSAIIDAGLLVYSASATVSGGATYRFEGLDGYGTTIWTVNSLKADQSLPSGTRGIRVTIGGPKNAIISNVSFKIPSTNLPKCSPLSLTQEVVGGQSLNIPLTVAYAEDSISLTATSSNTAVIPSVTISPVGSGYTKTISATSVSGASGTSVITVKAGATAISTFSIIVKSAPGAPTEITAVGGDSCATVSFTPPVSNGGSTITEYTVTSNPGNITATGTASPINITGLTNGNNYTFTVKATNDIGTGSLSAPSTAILLLSAPGAPTGVTAVPLNEKAEVSFSAPSSNGGSSITGYTVTSYPEGKIATGTASPLTVDGLTNGTSYTFKVSATNSKGQGIESAASNAVAPRTVPGIPTDISAIAGNGDAKVSFTAPSSGGSAITEYTVTSSPGGFTTTGATSPITVTGLTNGTAYTFKVLAKNEAGSGLMSDSSTEVIPMTVPEKPTDVSVVAGDTNATISFTPPSNDGGSGITGYRVTSNPGGLTATGVSGPITITGLVNGTKYIFDVVAINKMGASAASAPSNAVTPITVPGKPTAVIATPGNGEASISFIAPVDNGGNLITGYTVTSNPGKITASGTSSPLTVTGLTNGTFYTFAVTAVNAAGTGGSSDSSNSVMPDTPNYTITYMLNNGTGTVPTETTKKENATFVAKACSITPPDEMQFKEWNTKADGLGTAYKSGATITVGTENIILYAVWEIIPKVLSVSISPTSTLLEKGTDQKLVATVVTQGTATNMVSWTCSDASGKVLVDNTGLVTVAADAVAAEYTITATSNFDRNKKNVAIIRVAPSLEPYNTTLKEVKESDYFADSWGTYQAVLASNTVTRANTQVEVDNAIKAIKAAQKNLVSYPLAKEIKTANVLIIGQYAFELGNDSYTLSNFTKANITKYLNPATNKNEIYYFAGGKWYDLIKNDGKGLVDPIDPSLINGNGKYIYLNMVEKRP